MTDNYFLKLTKSRKTTYEFSDQKVSDKDLNNILEDGHQVVLIPNHGISLWLKIKIQSKN